MIRAVFGGSFDPVHTGHREIVRAVLAREMADHVHIVPTWLSPHKTAFSAPAADRLAMVRLVFADEPRTTVEAVEVAAGRVGFTVDTLEELAERFPGDRLRLVVGADNLVGFPNWHRPQRVLELAELVVAARGGTDAEAAAARAGIPADRCRFLQDFDEPVSASEIRAMLAAGRSVEFLLPADVARYIRENGLYSG